MNNISFWEAHEILTGCDVSPHSQKQENSLPWMWRVPAPKRELLELTCAANNISSLHEPLWVIPVGALYFPSEGGVLCPHCRSPPISTMILHSQTKTRKGGYYEC